MSATLYFSNSPAVLLERLSANLANQDGEDPFNSPAIATPTAAMKRWVQLRLAEERGIVANVQFLHLERTLWRRLEELDQEHVVEDRKPARLLDEQGLQLLILGMLRRSPPDEVREYLAEAGAGRDRDALSARRLIQLSHKLAGFFREYEYSRVQEHGRKGLAYLWKHGQDCFREYLGSRVPKWRRLEVERLERWQKALYHALFREGGLRDAIGRETGQYAYTLPQYAEMVLAQPPRDRAQGKPPSYHLFGLSQISPFHRSLIRRLADGEALPGRQARFHIYSLNPCAEYWEDALHPRERRARQQEDLFRRVKYQEWRRLEDAEKRRLRMETESIQDEELHFNEENDLLALWGKPGRENIQLWLQITDYDFLGQFRESEGTGLLAAAQNAVLGRRGPLPPEERAAQDGSLQILACPEIHREVETVHQGIVDALLEDPSLRPDEIAVLVPDMGKYRDVLAAVFGLTAEGEAGHVPYNLSDSSASAESDYARAVAGLFELARGRFSRREVFALASNPCFRSGQGLDEETLRVWARWAGKLNIYHGFDGEDKRLRGYGSDPAHTWAHGLERLALGTVMEAPRADDLRHFDGLVPYADGDTADADTLHPFLVIVEGLHRDLAPLRDGRTRPWSAWLETLSDLLDHYLVPPPEQPLEAYVQAEIRRYLLELRGMDALEGLAGEGDAEGVPAELPMGLILERLQGLKAGREPHLAGGVNVAALSAMKSLPFKVVYVLGLGEGEFPEDESASTLDLRGYRRVIGDVDPSARNRYLFLETLACATGRLRLSWVSRDIRQGKPIQMCSVLCELVDYLENAVLAPEGGKPARFHITQVPLLSRSPALFPALAPADGSGAKAPWDPPPNRSRDERLLAWLEGRKAAFHGARRALPWEAYARSGLPERVRRTLFPPALPAAAEGRKEPVGPRPMPLDDFRLYLENPALYTLRRRHRISDWREEDPSEAEDEPFFCPYPKDIEILESVFLDRMGDWRTADRAAVRAAFEARYENLGLRGHMPTGHYRELDRDSLWEKAEKTLASLDGFLDPWRQAGGGLQVFRGASLGDGRSRSGAEPELRASPVSLRAAGLELEVHGHLPCLLRLSGPGAGGGLADVGGTATLVYMTGRFDRRRLLPAFLFYAAGLLSDSPLGQWLRSGPFTIHYLFQSGKGAGQPEKWAPFRLDPAEARRYLESLAASMLGEPDFDLLPFDIISGKLAPNGRLLDGPDYAQAIREELDRSDEGDEQSTAPAYTESLAILDPGVPDDAEAKVRARLAPFFNFREAT